MRGNRSRDTKPEWALRRALRARGITGYRVQWPLPTEGRRTADVAFPGRRVAVFLDGCFWHGCSEHAGRGVQTNSDYWRLKREVNQARDENTDAQLRAQGWTVVRLWEHVGADAAALAVDDVLRRAQ